MANELDKQLEAVAKARAVTTGDFPEEMLGDGDFRGEPIRSIGLHELTPNEERMALKKAAGVPDMVAIEMCRMAIAEVNEKPIDRNKGEDDVLFVALGPRRRQLVMLLFGDMHAPSDKATASFFKTRRTRA